MKVGIYFDMRNPPQWKRPWPQLYSKAIELCEGADTAGADSVWLSEHHMFDDGYLPQPLTMAAAIAGRTRRVRLGTAVLLAGLRHPLQLAEECAIVDIISNGRLELGVGTGYRAPEYDAFGVDIKQRYSQLEKTIVEVRRLWDEVAMPPPVQSPVPVWGGFFGPQGAKLAGRLNMGLLALDGGLLEPYRDGLLAGGHDPASARMGGVMNILVADDPEAAWATVKPHLNYQMKSYVQHSVTGTGRPAPPEVDVERMRVGRSGRRPSFQVLTADEAIALGKELAEEIPIQHLFVWTYVGAMPDALAERQVELIATEVAPALRDVGLG